MCGVFGMVIRAGTWPGRDAVEHDMRLLFRLTEPRGRQAAGVAVQHGGGISLFKQPERAGLMLGRPTFRRFLDHVFESAPDGAFAFIGHCRLVTHGSELRASNNHPIHVDDVVGVHNGVMTNSWRFHGHKQPDGYGEETDTEVLLALLSDALKQSGPQRAMAQMFARVRGSATVGVFPVRQPLLLVGTNFGSLYHLHSPEDGTYVFGSEGLILRRFLEKSRCAPSARADRVARMQPGTGAVVPFESAAPRVFTFAGVSGEGLPEEEPRTPLPARVVLRNPSPDSMRRCTRCILPASYPLIRFDEHGVCNQCRKYRRQVVHGRDELERILSRYRSRSGEPDCLIGLSGGRDSSYGLHLLKKEFGMNPIGFNFDWLLTSMKARHNIAKISGALGVEVVYRTSDYERDAENIRNNIYGWLRRPKLGMMTFVQAGDKPMYHYGRRVREELGLGLTVWCSGYQCEQREFFVGYTGMNRTLRNNPRLYNYGWLVKTYLVAYYGLNTVLNPGLWNRSIWDNFWNFWHCFVGRDNFLYLFEYYPYNEAEVERVLGDEYEWEADKNYGANQWRMDDFHTSFINFVYYTVGGFSEFDEYRSNQVREGLITRDEALDLARRDNATRLDSLRTFAGIVGFNLEHVLKRIEAIPKLYG